MIDLDAWQAEIWATTQQRYPDRCSPDARLAKLTEEVGEFAGEVVRLQEGRGDPDKAAAEFADALITLLSAASSVGIEAGPAAVARWAVLIGRPDDGFATDAEADHPLGRPMHGPFTASAYEVDTDLVFGTENDNIPGADQLEVDQEVLLWWAPLPATYGAHTAAPGARRA